jgi:hypothetical protein
VQVLVLLAAALVMSCGGKAKEPTSCQVVGEHLAMLDAGRMAKFMTEKQRAARAERWLSKCVPWTEEQRTCVLAADSMETASRCAGSTIGDGSANGSAKPASWTLKANDEGATVRRIATASDGDFIAAGELRQKLVLGKTTVAIEGDGVWIARLSPTGEIRWARGVTSKRVQPYVADLAIANDGSIVVDVIAKSAPRFARHIITADGSSDETRLVLDGELAGSEILPDGAVVIGTIAGKDPCVGSTFPIHGLSATGSVTWSACNNKSAKPALPSGMRYLAADSERRVALCGSFFGDAPAWGVTKAPATPTGTHAAVAAFTADGKHRWSQYVTSSDRDTCEGLVVTDAGVVVAMINSLPAMSVIAWNADGAQRWSKTCDELAPGDRDCNITAVAAREGEVVVAARNGGRTTFSRIDVAGVVTGAGAIDGGTVIDQLSLSPTSIVFGGMFDVVIGRL